MKLLVDTNLSPNWVGSLNQAGFEAVHWSEVGSANSDDPEIMRYAKAQGLVVLTNDLDFGAYPGRDWRRCAQRRPIAYRRLQGGGDRRTGDPIDCTGGRAVGVWGSSDD
jgi:hypothetical protein